MRGRTKDFSLRSGEFSCLAPISYCMAMASGEYVTLLNISNADGKRESFSGVPGGSENHSQAGRDGDMRMGA
jgi:hypothetical protein